MEGIKDINRIKVVLVEKKSAAISGWLNSYRKTLALYPNGAQTLRSPRLKLYLK